MRKLGLIGGMSWASTRTYYEHINRVVQQRVGAQHERAAADRKPRLRRTSTRCATSEDWDSARRGADAIRASGLERAGREPRW